MRLLIDEWLESIALQHFQGPTPTESGVSAEGARARLCRRCRPGPHCTCSESVTNMEGIVCEKSISKDHLEVYPGDQEDLESIMINIDLM